MLKDTDKPYRQDLKLSHSTFSDWFWEKLLFMRELELWAIKKKNGTGIEFHWEPEFICERKQDLRGNQKTDFPTLE